MQTKGGGGITSFMDEPSNDRPTGFIQECMDLLYILMNWEIYGFPIGVVVFIPIFFGIFFGFVWLMGKLLEKLGFDPSKRLWGSGNHSSGGDFGGDFGGDGGG